MLQGALSAKRRIASTVWADAPEDQSEDRAKTRDRLTGRQAFSEKSALSHTYNLSRKTIGGNTLNIYQIDNAIANFEFEVDEETGELLNAGDLDALQMAREEKLESVALWIKELDAEAAAIKAEKQSLDERMKAKEKQRDSLKKYLDNALRGEKFETARCKVSYRKSQSVEITDEAAFGGWATKYAPQLIRETIKREPDKAAIKKELKDGVEIAGVKLVESQNLSVK